MEAGLKTPPGFEPAGPDGEIENNPVNGGAGRDNAIIGMKRAINFIGVVNWWV